MKAFTLIELLIVVAIIAILAAIALPNFLEAQVRAKVSRLKSDLRTCAVGVEAYAVDNNSYPWDCDPSGSTEWDSWRQLTTPVAYLTRVFLDPYSTKMGPQTPFDYGIQRNRPSPTQRDGWAAASVAWAMLSVGPDRRTQWDWGTFGEVGYNLADQMALATYDPTNGTLSTGDIIRTSR